jgi:LPXTG-site transpeptidase (sortase) family protein
MRCSRAALTTALLALLLAACAPIPTPTQVPPTPVIGLATFTPAPTPPSLPTSTALSSGDPAQTAHSIYGDRLITYIRIPAIQVYSGVVPVGWQVDTENADQQTWDPSGAQVGWVLSSALPGDAGNVLLYGHNNLDGSVFRDLYQLKGGDEIQLQTGQQAYRYRVDRVEVLPVTTESADRQALEAYFKPTRTPHLTLLSCWPPDNNTHRVVVIAYPLAGQQ